VGYEIILQAIWLFLPAYAANGTALLVGGGLPIDFGRKWKDGRRIFGDGKTWRGFFVGSLIGIVVGFSLATVAKYLTEKGLNPFELDCFEGFPIMIPLVSSLSFGALIGDLVESFFKRRIGKERGEDWFPFDQLDFVLGALFLALICSSFLHALGLTHYNWFLKTLTPYHLLVILVLSPTLHIIANTAHELYRKKF